MRGKSSVAARLERVHMLAASSSAADAVPTVAYSSQPQRFAAAAAPLT